MSVIHSLYILDRKVHGKLLFNFNIVHYNQMSETISLINLVP